MCFFTFVNSSTGKWNTLFNLKYIKLFVIIYQEEVYVITIEINGHISEE